MVVTVSGKGQRGVDVLSREVREIGDDLGGTHAGCQPAQNVVDGDPHAADAGLAAPLARLDRDAFAVVFQGAGGELGVVRYFE